jgi:uncharacterized protein YndB with AHSA1/START domain
MTANDEPKSEREIVIERIVEAPRERVWQAWTQAEHIAKWWGPNGFSTTIHEMKVSVGGVWRFIMHGPNGMNFPNKIVFREVVRPERLVYDHSPDDGKDIRDFQSVATFADLGQKTKVVLRLRFDTNQGYEAAAKYAIAGANQTLARLDQHLAGMEVS